VDICVGQTASLVNTFIDLDVRSFAEIFNEEYARETRFGRRIVRGILTAGLISAVLGINLPGPGAIFIRNKP